MPTLQFKGKNIIWNRHLSVPYHTLEEVSKLHFQSDKGKGNLIIEGDNLLALKALLPMYAGKVKVVCIDPPYNTGNEGWVYNDNANSPLIKDWLGKEVGKDDLTRHDKWLCMMTPRLRLLRDLLCDEGIIFINIDDNEIYHMRCLMNEIFAEENFVALLPTIMNLKGNQDEFAFAGTHEYTLVYAKNKVKSLFYEFTIDDEELTDWEEDAFGFFKKGANLKSSGINAPREKRPNLFYPLLYKEGSDKIESINDEEFKRLYKKETKEFDDKFLSRIKTRYEGMGYKFIVPISREVYMSWRWEREKIIAEPFNIIIDSSDGDISIYKKQRPSLGDLPSKKPKTTFYKPEYSSGNGTNQIKELFGEKVFNNPKPLQLIKDFITVGSKDGDIILDSFSGSGTTGHAVMDLNKEDKGKRQFILVQMTEATEAEANKNICKDITRERIKRAIEKYDYRSGFQYLRVGQPLDAETLLKGKLPDFKTFAKYVYYLCTGEHLKEENKISEKKSFIGTFGKQAIYLIYKQDYDALIRMALDLEFAEKIISDQPDKKRIVYAPACFLDEEYMEANQIEFVSIPYNLFQRKNK